jgi:formamidopyrimidine-DNA glycosylase
MPEMQALAERLDALLAGGRFAGADPLSFSGLKTVTPAPDSLVGRELERVGRRAKYLLFEFGGPRLMAHLSQGGRVEIEDPPKTTRPKGAVVRLRMEERPAMLVREYGTERKAAWWVLAEGDDGPLVGLGPEPGSPEFLAFFREGTDRRQIHTILRDQRTVAGIGRGYADDILHRAGLSPFASLAALSPEQREGLLTATSEVLAAALEGERQRSGGLPPKLGGRFIVHGRAGTACPVCGADLRRVSFESHEVAYCPTCQTGGKVLSDRRLSRLLR